MNTKRTKGLLMFFAAAFVALSIPGFARAQGGYYDPYGRGRNGGYVNNYDRRILRDAAHHIKDRSKDFQKHVDKYFDHYNRNRNYRREERVDDLARNFRDAAERFKDRLGDARNTNYSYQDARYLIDLGQRIDRFVARNQLDSRTYNDWAQIRQDLNTIANAYGINWNSNDGYYRGGNYDPRYPNPNDRWRFPFPRP